MSIESKYIISNAPLVVNLNLKLLLQATDQVAVPIIEDKKVASMMDVGWLQWAVKYVHYHNVCQISRCLATYLSVDVMNVMCGLMAYMYDHAMDPTTLNQDSS